MSDSSEQKSSVSSELQALIQRYQQLSALGKPVDFDALCAEAPHLKQELQSLIDQQAIPGPTEETAADNRAEATLHRAPGTVDTTPSLHSGLETIQPGSDEAADVKPQEEMFGRYKLEKLLGEGAMGSVYLAADTSLERQVALKIPKFSDHQQQELMTRFLREARSAAAVNHPNICKILDIGDVDGKPFLTMDFIDGETLSSHVGSEALRDEQKIVQLVLTLAHALDDAHSQGIIHRDLKPGNVMLNSKGTPFITDFGLARKVEQSDESRLTQEGTILGTPAYMSPEQIEGNPDKIGPQSDLYSLGVIFYELLTGELPFSGTIPMMLGQILRDVPSPPSQLRQGLDKQLDTICLKMMEKSTEKRYASCAEVAKVLQSWIEKQSAALRAQPAAAPKAKQPASKKLQAHKQQIEQMLKKRQISQAVQALEKLTQLQAKGAEKYVTWAKAELKKTKKLAKQYHENLSATIASAGKLLSKHDYAATIKLLQQVPMEFRNDQATELLEEAIDLQDEVTWLSEDIRESLKKQNLKGIESNLNRLLEIKPGNKMARELYESLNSYGSGKKHKFDDKGKLIPSTAGFDAFGGVKVAAIVGGVVFLLMLAAITIYLKSGGRTIEVTIENPAWKVYIDGNHVELNGKEDRITLDVGGHIVRVENNGTIVKGWDKFEYTVNKDGKNVLDIKVQSTSESNLNGDAPPITKAPFDMKQAKAHQKAWADYLGLPVEKTNSVGMKLAIIPPGEFMMGEGENVVDVTLINPFRLSIHEVTQKQWKSIMGSEPWKGRGSVKIGDNVVATNLSWTGATEYCRKLTERERAAGRISADAQYRLPTEAEWEYACRAGSTTKYSFGDDVSQLGAYAWFDENTKKVNEQYAHAVGLKKPNPFGLYDMHGNAYEWSSDWYRNVLQGGTDPSGPTQGTKRAYRSGSWFYDLDICRSAFRQSADSSYGNSLTGFRIALSIDPAKLKPVVTSTAKPPSTANSYALEFDRDDVVTIDSLKIDDGKPYTLEAVFVRERGSSAGSIYAGHPVNLKLGEPGVLIGTTSRTHAFYTHRTGTHRMDAGAFPEPPQRINLAMVHTGRELLGFRNGRLIGRVDTSDVKPGQPKSPFVIGQGLKGRFEMLRLSRTARYTADYKPADRFTTDKDTIALYNFDEGSGDVLKDSSGNNHHGKIVGAKWLKVEGNAPSKTITPADGWTNLFNGKDLTGWNTAFDASQWTVKDNVIVAAGKTGWLATEKEYTNFELELEYKPANAANGGIFLRIPKSGTPNGSEFLAVKLIDDNYSNYQQFDNHKITGSLYNLADVSQKATIRTNDWNRVRVRAVGRKISTWINGQQLVKANLNDLTQHTKGRPDILRATGHIGLQCISLSPIEYRNIRIRELDKNGKPLAGTNPDRNAAEWVLSIGGKVKTDTDKNKQITTVKDLPQQPFNLLEIDVNNIKQITDDGLRNIANLPKLHKLKLHNTPVTDAGMVHLANLKDLKELQISSSPMTADGLSNLKDLSKLEILLASNCPIDSSGAAHLRNLLSLKILSLEYTQTDDSGLQHLKTMQSLIELNLIATQVTAKGIDDFRKAKPYCTLYLDEPAGEQGWQMLFNGKDLTGWKAKNSASNWQAKNSVITGTGTEGWLATDKEFSNFVLQLEYKLADKLQSGIYLRMPATGKVDGSEFLEVQLANEKLDGSKDVPLTRKPGALSGIAAVTNLNEALPNVWNRITVQAVGNQISVWLNGKPVLDRNLQKYASEIQTKKHAFRSSGYIGLQKTPGGKVEFRNIRIRELDENGNQK